MPLLLLLQNTFLFRLLLPLLLRIFYNALLRSPPFVFDASSSGDEVTVSAKSELAHKVLSFVPNVGAAGAKHVYHLDT